jgi:hypothetical protein
METCAAVDYRRRSATKRGSGPIDNRPQLAKLPDPTLNPVYADMLRHYGVVVGHAQKTPLKGMRFEGPEEAQAYLDHWEARWADTRIHGTTKRQVAAMFAEKRSALLPLPIEPFRYYQYGERTVHLDGCVEVEAAYYGVPPGWISRCPLLGESHATDGPTGHVAQATSS